MWNHIVKNFQVKHGQCDSVIFPKNIFFWRLQVIARPLSCWQYDSLLFICPGIYPQVYHRTACPVELICKEVKQKQRRCRIIFSQMERLFLLLWKPSAPGGNLTIWPPFLDTPRKVFLSPSVWPRREYTWTLNLRQSLWIYFENCQDAPFSHRKE